MAELTIDEVMRFSPEELVQRCHHMLTLFPVLRACYDDLFINELVRRRNSKNHLLFALAQPEDPIACGIWTEICSELDGLEAAGAIAGFRDKLRARGEVAFTSARTELHFAAWMARSGKEVRLEPAVGNRKAEFVAAADQLAVHFEVKSLQDREAIRADDAIADEVCWRLRALVQPYILHLVGVEDIAFADCAKIVKQLHRDILAHDKNAGALPFLFECGGVSVEAAASTNRAGFLGSSMGRGYSWADENIRHARSRIHSSLGQLPAHGAGVVVIDRTPSIFIEHDDVFEACFGTSSLRLLGGRLVDYYDESGVFHPSSHTRISAVVSHSRRFLGKRNTIVYHNPFAQQPLPPQFLAGDDVEQQRYDFTTGRMVTFL